jgi:putative ATP-dependent endonuclease of the OLD family
MQIRQLLVKNFRGIKYMDWIVDNPIVCLIGPGDSTKSTILDAIEYVFSPNWNISIDDSDFYQENISEPIEIIATIGKFPIRFLNEQKFGLFARGWGKEGLNDEPSDADEQVLSIRLKIDSTLEPEWTIFNNRDLEGTKISHLDREALGVVKLGDQIEKHLSWRRGSALLHLTDLLDNPDNKNQAGAMITEANRMVRESINIESLKGFIKIAQNVETAAGRLGVRAKTNYSPALDPGAVNISTGAISLHDEKIPLRLAGLGSRRLIALALHLLCVDQGDILLVDEIEHGLEPFRIRHLLRILQQSIQDSAPSDENIGQIILTSHCQIVLVEMNSENLSIVRSENGITTVLKVGSNLQTLVRAVPEALLGKKVVVCEGKTEWGFCRGIAGYWDKQLNQMPPAYYGVSLVLGEGTSSYERALELAKLGYITCLFIDSDKLDELKPPISEIETQGVKVIYWDGSVSIEQRIALDLEWDDLKELIKIAIRIKTEDGQGEECIYDAICTSLGTNRGKIGSDIEDWLSRGYTKDQIRVAVGKAAKGRNNSWFKREDHGIELGDFVINHLTKIQDRDLAKKIEDLKCWIYG